MNILGLNAFHGDSSAALVVDGILVAAVEEERFLRVKHWAGFPAESIRYCLDSSGLTLDDVDHVAINQDSKANLSKKLAYTVKSRPDLGMVMDRIRKKRERAGVESHLAEVFPSNEFNGKVQAVEHHLAHLSSAFHVSPFKEAVVVSVDGFGDFASSAWGIGRGTDIDVDGRVYFPHSLGIFYQALTQYLGFPNYGDEYKVMGLAPYGEPTFIEQMREIVRLKEDGGYELNLRYFRHHTEKIEYEWNGGSPDTPALYSAALADLLGPMRAKDEPLAQKHKDIARSVQSMYEEAFFHLLNKLHNKHNVDAVAIAGGCGMNSVANGKITLKTPFKEVYVQSAAGDAGGAIGAAFLVWYEAGGRRIFDMEHSYWGPAYEDSYVEKMINDQADVISTEGCIVRCIDDESQLCKLAAERVARGEVLGWFQGRMEWGPRALGNRSIVCDPRRADMKDILNLKIKRRESFRPFAPSILREKVHEWFEIDGDVPFMMQVFQIKPEQRERIPAVTHVDGSGRLQTVKHQTNARYYRLIEAFNEMTGVPMLLNTSFNENEPVVCKPEEALACFLRTKMDLVIIGNWVVERPQP